MSLNFVLRRRRRDGVATSLSSFRSSASRLVRRFDGVLAGLGLITATSAMLLGVAFWSRDAEAREARAEAGVLLTTGVVGALDRRLSLLTAGLKGRASAEEARLSRRAVRGAGLDVRSSTERARLQRFREAPPMLQMLLRRPVLGVPANAMGVCPGKEERLRGRCGVTAVDNGFSMTNRCHFPKSSHLASNRSRAAGSLSLGAKTREVVQL